MTEHKDQPTTVTQPSKGQSAPKQAKKAKTKDQSNADLNDMNDGNKIFEAQEKAREEKREQEEEMLRQSAEGGR